MSFPPGAAEDAIELTGEAGELVHRPSLRRNAVARLIADVSAVLIGAAVAVITARWLGPEGRGVFAAIAFLGVLMTRVCVVGLGDAAIVFVGQRRVTAREAVRASVAILAGFSIVGVAIFFGVAAAQIQPESGDLWLAVVLAPCLLPLSVYREFLGSILTMQERIVEASAILVLGSLATLLGVVAFVIVLDLRVAGAVLGVACGTSVGLIGTAALTSRGLSFRPAWRPRYIAAALKYGVRVESSYLVAIMAGRLDLLLVLSLAGRADAGFYSVALTLGEMVGLAPFALTYAAFPRLAVVDEDESWALTARVSRLALAAALLVALGLGAVTAPIVPVLFGERFDPAIAPALVLIGAGVFASGQWALARSQAARGRPRLLLTSYGTSLGVMLALDALLIPLYDVVGAAVAAATAAGSGFAVCLLAYRRTPAPIGSLLPRPADFAELFAEARQLLRRGGPPRAGQPGR